MKFKITKGLDLPISGDPKETLDLSKKSTKVALVGTDFVGMKPSMMVAEGDTVKLGQPVFSCKKNEGLVFTSPASGKVSRINRGEKRAFQSLEIEVSESEEAVKFENHITKSVLDYTKEEVEKLLLESGEWKYIRQRPYDKVATVGETPSAVFITAIDTNPPAPKPQFVIDQFKDEFKAGVDIISKLSKDRTYVCVAPESGIDFFSTAEIRKVEFAGAHPAGLAGTHIHMIDPVNPTKMAWHVGYQDVIAIGRLFLTGTLLTDKIISLGGPLAQNPRYLKVRRSANVTELVEGETEAGTPLRVIAGSVFHGHVAEGPFAYLGAYTNQITAIEEDHKRVLLGWHSPGFNRFSIKPIYVSKLMPWKKFNLGSSTHGSPRSMVPTGNFEAVMPLDILPTQLLRALESNDTDTAQDLGALELAEEDMALMTFVSTGKTDFGPVLRRNLETIEREG